MKLVELTVEDLRCLRATQLRLRGGINVIAGANGAGKSTLLEAIGFALFGALPSRGDDDGRRAIRDGAERATVEVRFTQGADEYRVRRTLSDAGPEAQLFRAAGGPPIAEAEAVDRTLADLLDIADPALLPALFRRLVGVAQGTATAPQLRPAGARREHYAALLNLDRYELAARRALQAAAPFRERLEELDRERERHEGEHSGWESVVRRLAECEQQQPEAERLVVETESSLTRLGEELARLEATRARLEQLHVEGAVLTESLRGRQDDEDRARRELAEAETAAAVVREHKRSFDCWQQLEAECRALEMRRTETGDVRAEVEGLERRLADGRSQIDAERDTLDARLEGNQERAEELLGTRDQLRAQVEASRARMRRAQATSHALERAQERSARLAAAVRDIEPQGSQIDAETERAAAEVRAAAKAAAEAAASAREAELEALRRRAASADQARADLEATRLSLGEMERLRQDVEARLADLQPAHGACPFLAEPCQNIGGASLVDHFSQERDRLAASHQAAVEAARYAAVRAEEADQAQRELAAAESRPAAAAPAAATQPPRRRVAGAVRYSIPLRDLVHDLSGLAGIIGALEPENEREAPAAVALIGKVAGVGQRGALPPSPKLRLPALAEIEKAHELAHAGSQLQRPGEPGEADRVHDICVELALMLRKISTGLIDADAQLRNQHTTSQEQARTAEETMLQASRELEELAVERAEIRAAAKRLTTEDIDLLETERALGDGRVRLAAFEQTESDLEARQAEQKQLREGYERFQEHALLAHRVEAMRDEWKRRSVELTQVRARLAQVEEARASAVDGFDASAIERIRGEREQANLVLGQAREAASALTREAALLRDRVDELEEVRQRIEEIDRQRERLASGQRTAAELAEVYRAMAEPVAGRVRARIVAEADRLARRVSGRGTRLTWDEDFALAQVEAAGARHFAELARGDQMTLALSLQVALLAQFPRVGLLLLDEPAAHLDAERRLALADLLDEFLTSAAGGVEQIVLVSHDDGFDGVARQRSLLG